jgi:hypothetical protein
MKKRMVTLNYPGVGRNDIFIIKSFSEKNEKKVILNENKLQSIYK